MEPYIVLGACNPDHTHRALQIDRGIGMPCDVVVSAEAARSVFRAFETLLVAEVTGSEDLAPIAAEAARRLTAALSALPQVSPDAARRTT